MGLTARRNLSALLFAVFASLQVLAAVPALHTAIHEDASSPNHECAVTMFLHGQVNSSDVAVAVIVVPPPVIVHESIPANPFISRGTPLRPGRGPPVLS
jgi:hypothetical protein